MIWFATTVSRTYEDLLSAARALTPPPVAIEAMWDGDTHGWFVDLCAVVPDGASYRSRSLGVFSDGGDIRLFQGQVPPWPEARTASQMGGAIAEALGVPFFFPSPELPEQDCPHWWQRDAASPCARCGILLLQKTTCPWRGHCYRCHLRLEREEREASWTPEQRAAPKCHLCGTPAVGEEGPHARCATCRVSYVDWACDVCGCSRTTHVDYKKGDTCDDCVMAARLASLSDAERAQLEATFRESPVDAAIAFHDATGAGIVDGMRALEKLFGDEP